MTQPAQAFVGDGPEPAALPSDLAEPGYGREWTRPPVAEAGREGARRVCAALMDNMIACSERQVVTRVAVAPAVTQVGVASQVRAGIAAEAQLRGLTTGLAHLKAVNGRSVLEHRNGCARALDCWLREAERRSDLIVVDGLPLDVSFDTALVARVRRVGHRCPAQQDHQGVLALRCRARAQRRLSRARRGHGQPAASSVALAVRLGSEERRMA